MEVRAIDATSLNQPGVAHKTSQKDLQADTGGPLPAAQALPAAEAIENKINIYVQLGAFRHAGNAQKLRLAFSAHNLGQVSVKTFPLDAAPIYKVWLGPLNTIELADHTVAQLDQLGHHDYRIVFETQPQLP